MKCPACLGQLTEVQVGDLLVDLCQDGCGGIWFDAFELQRVDEAGQAGEPLLHVRRNPQVSVDPALKRECPRCAGVKLHRHYFSAQRRVQVDQCPNCAGYWLDAGELAQIREEKSQTHQAEQARQSSVSAEFIRYLYRLEHENRHRPHSNS
jgi:Zn-finger nucleic acid-binding protein